jgi:hypothetical protein
MEYLSFSHGGHHYAVPLENVRYIAAATALKTTKVAYGNERLQDTINYEGHSCLVMNLADLLGESPELKEGRALVGLLNEREQDHIRWLTALETAIRDNSSFHLARKHTECAFGRWYAGFHTHDPDLQAILQRFDQPHQRIHQLADELLSLRDQQRMDEALEILEHHKRTTLARLRDLFADARQQIDGVLRPTVVVLQRLSHPDDPARDLFGLRVDHIGDVFSSIPACRTDNNDDWLPTFADGWLKDISINNNKVTALALAPARI